jgi:hypothetical protein
MSANFLDELRPVHVKALAALLNPQDEAFFRQHLSPLTLVKLKAHRAWAADEYLSHLMFNVTAIANRAARFWDTATPEAQPELGELADAALGLRQMLLKLRLRTWASVLAPVDLGFDVSGYAQVLNRASRLLQPTAA